MSCSSSQISNFTRLVPFNLQFNYFIAVLFGYDEQYIRRTVYFVDSLFREMYWYFVIDARYMNMLGIIVEIFFSK